MLIGYNNEVNKSLLRVIGSFAPMQLKEYAELSEENATEFNQTPYFFVNLMDMTNSYDQIVQKLRIISPTAKLIGLHCFEVDTMIKSVLDAGFDNYIPLLKMKEELPKVILKLGIVES